MIKILILIQLFNSSIIYAKKLSSPKTVYQIKKLISKISKEQLEKDLREFVNCCGDNRTFGSQGNDLAVDFLLNKIKRIDQTGNSSLVITPFIPDIEKAKLDYTNDFRTKVMSKFKPKSDTYKKWNIFTENIIKTLDKFKNLKGKNLIWEKKGILNPEKVIIIGAHFDTIGFDYKNNNIDLKSKLPGANDNATGVVALLKLIEVISKIDLAKTVRIIFFDFQELGNLGSYSYLKEFKETLSKEEILGYINIEMIGHDSKFLDKTKQYNNMKAYLRPSSNDGYYKDLKLYESFTKMSKKFSRVDFVKMANGYDASDHKNFWDMGIPAVIFTQDLENDYDVAKHHTSKDFVESINMKTYFESVKYILGSLITWNFDIIK